MKASDDHTYADVLADLATLQTALRTDTKGMCEDEAFSTRAKAMLSFEWGRTFLYFVPDLQWAQMRLVSLACSASACEHSWSIEGWIHSKKRNRLGACL